VPRHPQPPILLAYHHLRRPTQTRKRSKQTQKSAARRRWNGVGGDVAADAMDDGRGRAVGAGRGHAGDDGGHGAPRPRGSAAARPLSGPPRHPAQAARLLPPLHGLPARPLLLCLKRRPLRPPRPPPPPRAQLVTNPYSPP
jgi:hypothetical protein